MLVVERFRPAPLVFRRDRTPVGRAVAVGCCQTLALVPGVSQVRRDDYRRPAVRGSNARRRRSSRFFSPCRRWPAAFAHDLWDVRHELVAGPRARRSVSASCWRSVAAAPGREAVSAVTSAVRDSRRSPGTASRRASRLLGARWPRAGSRSMAARSQERVLQWLRAVSSRASSSRSASVVSVVALVWAFRFADGVTGALRRTPLRHSPGPAWASSRRLLAILAIGALTTNVFGRRLLDRSENILQHVPLFRTSTRPSSSSSSRFRRTTSSGFKRMVLVRG